MQRTFLLSLISVTASLTSLGFGNTTASAITGAALFGVFAGIAPPYVYHVVAERSDAYTRSRAFGVLNAFNFLGGFLNPVVLGPLARVTGIHGVFLTAAGGYGSPGRGHFRRIPAPARGDLASRLNEWNVPALHSCRPAR